MNKYELMSFETFAEDQYTAAMAKVRIEGKYIVTYCLKRLKDGGSFWAVPSMSITKNGAKVYVDSFMMDSRFEEEELKNFVKSSINAHQEKVATTTPPKSFTSQQTPFMSENKPTQNVQQPHNSINFENMPF